MHIRRLLAWILSAALAVSLLAGCGREDVLKLLLALLEGQYTNLTVEADADLEQTLRRVAGENSSEEEMDAALQKILGTTVQFEDLEDGQSGEHSFDLVFQSGKDAESAARQTFLKWDKVFSSLPSGGQYHADLAMLEADNGYYILVDVTVKKAGSGSKPDKDDDKENNKPEEEKACEIERDTNGDITKIVINDVNGLEELAKELNKITDPIISLDADIELRSDAYLTSSWPDNIVFSGTLTGHDNTITLQDDVTHGMFMRISDSDAVVKDANFVVEANATIGENGFGDTGVLAGDNIGGSIENCNFTIHGTISGNGDGNVGGIVGNNEGTIKNCEVALGDAGLIKDGINVGGVAGNNNADIIECLVTDEGSEKNKIEGSLCVGGVAGCNDSEGNITGCDSEVNIWATEQEYGTAGGVIGYNEGDYSDNNYTGEVYIGSEEHENQEIGEGE